MKLIKPQFYVTFRVQFLLSIIPKICSPWDAGRLVHYFFKMITGIRNLYTWKKKRSSLAALCNLIARALFT